MFPQPKEQSSYVNQTSTATEVLTGMSGLKMFTAFTLDSF
jgi:hypothetical protein